MCWWYIVGKFCITSLFTWGFLRWIPFAVNEAATWHVDPALRQHEQRSDRRGEQSEKEAQSLQGGAACAQCVAHQHQSLWMKGKGINSQRSQWFNMHEDVGAGRHMNGKKLQSSFTHSGLFFAFHFLLLCYSNTSMQFEPKCNVMIELNYCAVYGCTIWTYMYISNPF